MTRSLVEVDGLTMSFPTAQRLLQILARRPARMREVLSGVSFRLGPGDWLALLGANGAGKTTILKTLATLLQPTTGTAQVCGYDVVRQARQVRAHVGYVCADERSFHWRLTARANLEFFAALQGLSGAQARRRIHVLLEALDLLDAADSEYATFSSGMKQRLSVARALLGRPRVLLMDEPTRSLDDVHAAAVWRLVRDEMTSAEGAVLLVTHQLDEAMSQCRRLAVLAQGRIVRETAADRLPELGPPAGVFTAVVRGLPAHAWDRHPLLRSLGDCTLLAQDADEQTLELRTHEAGPTVADWVTALSRSGATICSLQRTTDAATALERLIAVNEGDRHS